MPPDVATWVGPLANGAPAVVVAFVVWFLLSKHLPHVVKNFGESLAQMEDNRKEAIAALLQILQKQLDAFRQELGAERVAHEVGVDRIHSALERQNQLLALLFGRISGGALTEAEKKALGV